MTVVFVGLSIWIGALLVFSWTQYTARQANLKTACSHSQAVAAALQLVPYKLRAVDVLLVIPTLNKMYNVEVQFYEASGRTTDLFTLSAMEGRNNDIVVFEGETNWVGFRVHFNNAADVNIACLANFNTFSWDY